MGNHRFRLSDMIPNAWFYKLKDMSKLKNHHKTSNPTSKVLHAPPTSSSSSSSSSSPSKQYPSEITKLPHLSDQRKSYYFTRDLTLHPNSPVKTTKTSVSDHLVPTEPPRRSFRRRRTTKRTRLHKAAPPISAGCSCRTTLESVWTKTPEYSMNSPTRPTSSSEHGSTITEYGSDRGLTPDDDAMLTSSSPCKCRAAAADNNNNVVINVDVTNHPVNIHGEFVGGGDLPPIITRKQNRRPANTHRTSGEIPEKIEHGPRKLANSSSSPGLKLRTNTPRIANRRIGQQGRKSVGSRRSTETFAVVKSSRDPGRDFRESMVEMIVENNIRASKDLEELLACYLSLNSDEYHDLIINVFKQIWFDFIRFRLN